MQGKYLITADQYFIAPDGKNYRAAWGDVIILSDNILGIKTNLKSTNWYARVGSEDNHVIIAGCQIHYACRCENKPNTGRGEDWNLDGNGYIEHDTPTKIYIPE